MKDVITLDSMGNPAVNAVLSAESISAISDNSVITFDSLKRPAVRVVGLSGGGGNGAAYTSDLAVSNPATEAYSYSGAPAVISQKDINERNVALWQNLSSIHLNIDNPSAESISGTALKQADVNKEFTSAINTITAKPAIIPITVTAADPDNWGITSQDIKIYGNVLFINVQFKVLQGGLTQDLILEIPVPGFTVPPQTAVMYDVNSSKALLAAFEQRGDNLSVQSGVDYGIGSPVSDDDDYVLQTAIQMMAN